MSSSVRILVPFQVKYNIVHGFSVLLSDSVHRYLYEEQALCSAPLYLMNATASWSDPGYFPVLHSETE